MIAQTSRHDRRSVNPAIGSFSETELKAQTMMVGAEVVDGSDQIHARLKGRLLARQMAGAARQAAHALTKGGIAAARAAGIGWIAAVSTSSPPETLWAQPGVGAVLPDLRAFDWGWLRSAT